MIDTKSHRLSTLRDLDGDFPQVKNEYFLHAKDVNIQKNAQALREWYHRQKNPSFRHAFSSKAIEVEATKDNISSLVSRKNEKLLEPPLPTPKASLNSTLVSPTYLQSSQNLSLIDLQAGEAQEEADRILDDLYEQLKYCRS